MTFSLKKEKLCLNLKVDEKETNYFKRSFIFFFTQTKPPQRNLFVAKYSSSVILKTVKNIWQDCSNKKYTVLWKKNTNRNLL